MEYCVNYYTYDELYHHGVKGMKWGVRRYQNTDGSLTPAGKKQLTAYRNKELYKNEKKYDNTSNLKRRNKTDVKIQKAKIAGKDKRVEKLTAERRNIDVTMKYNDAMKKVERSKIKKLSYSQMRDEKHKVKIQSGKAALETVLVSTLASAVLLPTTGRIYIHAVTANPNAIKTNMRVSETERKKIAQNIYKK